jgi:hypothetical protein
MVRQFDGSVIREIGVRGPLTDLEGALLGRRSRAFDGCRRRVGHRQQNRVVT